MIAAGRTDVGLVRARNEDAYYVGEYLFAVADGLGGHVAGDVASRTVIEALRTFDRPVPAEKLGFTLARAVDAAGRSVRQQIQTDPALAGMGSTVVGFMRAGCKWMVVNVGDSRAYLLRGTKLIRVTDDHTYARLMTGTSATASTLPERITRFVDGRIDGRSPDLASIEIRTGDRMLLCSDGLSSFVNEAEIVTALGQSPVRTASEQLVAAALAVGGPDNVTVVVIDA